MENVQGQEQHPFAAAAVAEEADEEECDLMMAQLRAQMEAMVTDGPIDGDNGAQMETEEERQAMDAAAASTSPIPVESSPSQPPLPPPSQQGARNRRTPLEDPDPNEPRPWDDVVAAGVPAQQPPSFDRPYIARGERASVCVYIPALGGEQQLHNVLMRDTEHEHSGPVTQAYYPIPYKRPIKTIMGHVEICAVLKRKKNKDDTSRKSDFEEESEEEASIEMDDEDDELCFELTDQFVAVKVNYAARVNKLRDRHAEDPMKEIAAMQLVGDDLPSVMGTSEVLYVSGRDVVEQAARVKQEGSSSKQKLAPLYPREEDNDTINVVLRYCQHGDLFDALQQPWGQTDRPGFSEPQARSWFHQIMVGIRDLHAKGVCHRDLSPENVMIDDNGCVIIDLGMCLRVPYTTNGRDVVPLGTSRVENQQQRQQRASPPASSQRKLLFMPQGACGKLPYMSPEIYRNRRPFDGAAVDVWCAGTILFCMLTGNRSYHRPHATDPQFYWMTHGLNQLLADWNITLSPEGHHLLRNMLQVDARLRLTIDEVLAHPWFDLPHEPITVQQPMA